MASDRDIPLPTGEPKRTRACPCCGIGTLPQRGAGDECTLCGWRDWRGQNEHYPDREVKGQNFGLSLAQARKEYRVYGSLDRSAYAPNEVPAQAGGQRAHRAGHPGLRRVQPVVRHDGRAGQSPVRRGRARASRRRRDPADVGRRLARGDVRRAVDRRPLRPAAQRAPLPMGREGVLRPDGALHGPGDRRQALSRGRLLGRGGRRHRHAGHRGRGARADDAGGPDRVPSATPRAPRQFRHTVAGIANACRVMGLDCVTPA
ncbi:MAG: hypothetical protein K8F93_16650 [Burkholderiales bacterium]|nr:hypothetical protein [Burkholderiales bacterium]MCL4687723.1 hypothetical protein [Burkholderiales bacterium]